MPPGRLVPPPPGGAASTRAARRARVRCNIGVYRIFAKFEAPGTCPCTRGGRELRDCQHFRQFRQDADEGIPLAEAEELGVQQFPRHRARPRSRRGGTASKISSLPERRHQRRRTERHGGKGGIVTAQSASSRIAEARTSTVACDKRRGRRARQSGRPKAASRRAPRRTWAGASRPGSRSTVTSPPWP